MVFIARITLNGLDDILDVLRNTTEDMTEVVDKMLIAGGEVANKAQQESIDAHRHIRTGSMRANVRFEEPRLSLYSSGRYVSSYSRGADKFGTSNQKKAFILNYGSSGHIKRFGGKPVLENKKKVRVGPKIGASHWFDEAYEKANPQITAAMRKVWDEWNPETGEGV